MQPLPLHPRVHRRRIEGPGAAAPSTAQEVGCAVLGPRDRHDPTDGVHRSRSAGTRGDPDPAVVRGRHHDPARFVLIQQQGIAQLQSLDGPYARPHRINHREKMGRGGDDASPPDPVLSHQRVIGAEGDPPAALARTRRLLLLGGRFFSDPVALPLERIARQVDPAGTGATIEQGAQVRRGAAQPRVHGSSPGVPRQSTHLLVLAEVGIVGQPVEPVDERADRLRPDRGPHREWFPSDGQSPGDIREAELRRTLSQTLAQPPGQVPQINLGAGRQQDDLRALRRGALGRGILLGGLQDQAGIRTAGTERAHGGQERPTIGRVPRLRVALRTER